MMECRPSDVELARGANEEYELMGHTLFQPKGALETYIQYTLSYSDTVPVKVRFGNLSHGIMHISGHAIELGTAPLTTFSFQKVNYTFDCFNLKGKLWE